MNRNIFAFSACLTVFAALCLGLAFGGCGKGSPEKVAAPAARGTRALIRIGEDPGLIGRVEEEVVVKAVVFDAEDAEGRVADVVLTPGAWLVPARAMRQPIPFCGSRAGDADAQ